jgi:hypothetical protein
VQKVDFLAVIWIDEFPLLFKQRNQRTDAKSIREALFVSLLENVNKEEATLLLAMKDKKSPIKGLTKNLVATAFPGLLPDEQTT